jgi:hypothetical protein
MLPIYLSASREAAALFNAANAHWREGRVREA